MCAGIRAAAATAVPVSVRVTLQRANYRQLPGFVERYLHGEIKIDEMISEVLPLEDINKAFDLMHEGKVIRSVIRF